MAGATEKATFGAGCFWGVEAAFRQVPGVVDAAVGYEGGTMPNPTYRDVCTDETGHAEVVEVTFDPSRVSYDQILDVFWANHDPTQRTGRVPTSAPSTDRRSSSTRRRSATRPLRRRSASRRAGSSGGRS